MFKKYLRLYLINLAAVASTAYVIEGVSYQGGFRSLAWITLIFLLVETFLKPLAKLLLLPINLLTLGVFRWVINVLVLYLVTRITPELIIKSFYFDGFNSQGFSIPAINISLFWVFVLASFSISLVAAIFIWLIKK